MKKKVSISIDSKIWDFMETNFTNKSALIETLIIKYYTEKSINIPKETPAELEAEEIINAPRTD